MQQVTVVMLVKAESSESVYPLPDRRPAIQVSAFVTSGFLRA